MSFIKKKEKYFCLNIVSLTMTIKYIRSPSIFFVVCLHKDLSLILCIARLNITKLFIFHHHHLPKNTKHKNQNHFISAFILAKIECVCVCVRLLDEKNQEIGDWLDDMEFNFNDISQKHYLTNGFQFPVNHIIPQTVALIKLSTIPMANHNSS